MSEFVFTVSKSEAELDNETYCLAIHIMSMRQRCRWLVVQASELLATLKPATMPVVVLATGNAVVSTGFRDAAEFLGSSKPG